MKLHSSEINIKKASVALSDGSALENLPVHYDKKWTTVTLELPKEVSPQSAKLSLEFDGTLNDKMRGFYRSSYKDAKGNEKFIASTQFESTYARLSFPCWDEPIYKATFDISLVVDKNLTALSNMNAVKETDEGTKRVVKYATTPLMSTYLVAFAVGDLEYIEMNEFVCFNLEKNFKWMSDAIVYSAWEEGTGQVCLGTGNESN
ncbi:unnamed protein product [Anisakis simplex]|uniref:Aminopeptidase N-like N-terminal domain-containing protein n=1 Tax=Anisakis simplex TaxID=6269 RepID=A0A3P6NPL4_ANISI|nr:unnamed protein product [Anisakis simplex]